MEVWFLIPLIDVDPKKLFDCCQWAPFVEENYTTTLLELKRVEKLEKKRAVLKESVADVKSKLLNLHRQLRQVSTQTDLDRRKLIMDFLRTSNMFWANKHQGLLYQSKQKEFPLKHVLPDDIRCYPPSVTRVGWWYSGLVRVGEPLAVYARSLQGQLEAPLRAFQADLYHTDCTTKFIKIHTQIVPILIKLQQCDEVYQEAIFLKSVKIILMQQVQEAQSFVLDFAPEQGLAATLEPPQTPQEPEESEPEESAPEEPAPMEPQAPKPKKRQPAINKITLRYSEPRFRRPVTISPYFSNVQMIDTPEMDPDTAADIPPEAPVATQLAVNMPVRARARKQVLPTSNQPKKRGRPRKVVLKPPQSAELPIVEAGPGPSGHKKVVAKPRKASGK